MKQKYNHFNHVIKYIEKERAREPLQRVFILNNTYDYSAKKWTGYKYRIDFEYNRHNYIDYANHRTPVKSIKDIDPYFLSHELPVKYDMNANYINNEEPFTTYTTLKPLTNKYPASYYYDNKWVYYSKYWQPKKFKLTLLQHDQYKDLMDGFINYMEYIHSDYCKHLAKWIFRPFPKPNIPPRVTFIPEPKLKFFDKVNLAYLQMWEDLKIWNCNSMKRLHLTLPRPLIKIRRKSRLAPTPPEPYPPNPPPPPPFDKPVDNARFKDDLFPSLDDLQQIELDYYQYIDLFNEGAKKVYIQTVQEHYGTYMDFGLELPLIISIVSQVLLVSFVMGIYYSKYFYIKYKFRVIKK
jgi:hypothetical protein